MSRGVVAAGHPLTAETGAWALREGGNAVDAAIAAVASSCVTESPLTGLGAGGYMLVHDALGHHRARLLRRRPGRRRGRAPIRARADRGPLHAGLLAGLQRRRGVVRCSGHAGRTGRGGAPFGTMPLAELVAPAARQARDGRRAQPRAGVLHRDPRPDPHPHRGGRRDLRPRRAAAAGRRPVPVPRPRRRVRAARLGRRGAVLRRRDRRRDQRVGDWSAAGPSAAPTSPPTRRSPARRSRRAFAAGGCSPTRRRLRAAC